MPRLRAPCPSVRVAGHAARSGRSAAGPSSAMRVPGSGGRTSDRERHVELAVTHLAAELAASRRWRTRSSRTSRCGLPERGKRAPGAGPRRASGSRRCCSRPARPLATSAASCSARRIAASAASARSTSVRPTTVGVAPCRPACEERRADLGLRCASAAGSAVVARCGVAGPQPVSEPVRAIATTSSRSRPIHTAR